MTIAAWKKRVPVPIACALIASTCYASNTPKEISSDYEGPGERWEIILNEDDSRTAIQFSNDATLQLDGLVVKARSAISGAGILNLSPTGEPSLSRIQGDWNFQNGMLSLDNGAPCSVQGEGELFGVSSYNGSAWTLQAGSSLRVGSLDVSDATVVLEGYSTASQTQGSGAWLFVPLEGGLSNESETSGATIHVKDNAALIVGTTIGRCDEIGSIEGDFAGRNTSIRQKMTTILADVDQCTQAGKASLVTSNLVLPIDQSQATQEMRIAVGAPAEGAPGVRIGSTGRWILYCPDYSEASSNGSMVDEFDIVPEEGATVVLYDWNPDTQSDLIIPGVWDNAYIVSQYARGRLVQTGDAMTPTQVMCQDFPGLRARELVAEVEDAQAKDVLKPLPGYRYVLDSFSVLTVGDEAYANHIDSAVFMPVNSGTLVASERLHEAVSERILRHRSTSTGADAHWWADVFGEKRTAKDMFQGGSGSWGYKAKSVALSLGADKRFENGWNATIALSGMSVNTDTKDLLMGVDGKATGVAVSAQALREGAWGRIGVQASVAKLQAESTKLAAEHRLKTEPELFSTKVVAFWQGDYRLDKSSAISPWLSVSGAYVKASKADVVDARTSMRNGVGFENEIERRFLGQVQAGLEWHAGTSLGNLGLSGGVGAYAGAAFGDTDWRIRSRLSGGSAVSVASYAAVPRWNAKLEAKVSLGKSERVENPSEKSRGFDWRCELWTSFERSEYTQNAWQGGLRFTSAF